MKIHLIGIGGIGVSALAQYYLSEGHQVSGSDLVRSEITDFLKKKGIKIFSNKPTGINRALDSRFRGNDKRGLPELVVFSPAVKSDNPELRFYKKNKIKCLSYPEAVGKLTKQYYTIAVAGSHGKSTTTAMLGLILEKAGLDPTVIVGTKVKEFSARGGPASGWGNNFRAGKSKLLVIEACEYDSSFLHYSPKIIVITNIDKEHLDYFKTFKNVKKAFEKFILRLPKNGFFIYNGDDENIGIMVKNCHSRESGNLERAHKPWIPGPAVAKALAGRQARNDNGLRLLRFARNDEVAKKIKKILKVPGSYNVSNALGAMSVARILEVPDEIILKALSEFEGTWRRFEERQVQISNFKFQIISDYAHHPNEISAVLTAVREKYPKNRILCIFQPHQHQRTHYLFNDFVKVFKEANIDEVIITDIYDVAGRETKKINKKISSKNLVEKVNKKSVIYCETKKLEEYINKNIKSGDLPAQAGVLIIMGAGDIYKLSEKLSTG